MKKLLLILLFLFYQHVSSQAYTPLLDNLNEWHFTSCYFGCITDVYYTDGDTLVNGKNYKILEGYHYINRNLLLREDVGQKKVYLTLTQPQFEEDILLYDFSLTEGDSIPMRNPLTPFPNQGGYFTVDSIRLLSEANGMASKYFYFSPSNSNSTPISSTTWVEGVGSISLINAPGGQPDINGVGKLSCAFKDTELFYTDLDSISGCEPLVLGINENELPHYEINIFTLPKTNHFLITNTNLVKNIHVYGLSGKKYKTFPFQNQSEIELDLSELNKGLYILVFNDSVNRIVSEKIIIH